jgi:uncharacterized protein
VSSFLGRGWSFPPRFSGPGMAAEMVSDFEDIEQSLRILFATHPGERVMQPAYGCGLRSLVFEDASEHLLTEIKDMLRRAILFFEPRIDVLKVEAQLVDPLGGHVSISLDYRVRTTNTRHNMVYPLYLHQATSPVEAA